MTYRLARKRQTRSIQLEVLLFSAHAHLRDWNAKIMLKFDNKVTRLDVLVKSKSGER